MKYRTVVLHALLSLLLLFSQQLAAAHVVTHLAHAEQPGTSRGDQLPGDMQCATCLAFAAIGSALPGASCFAAAGMDAVREPATTPDAGRADAILLAFDARAPPFAP